MRVLIVGGHPKNFPEPFSAKTKTGRIIRGIVKSVGIDAEYFDLWNNQAEEDAGIISEPTAMRLLALAKERQVVCLGKFIMAALESNERTNCLSRGFIVVKHPARASATELEDIHQILRHIMEGKDLIWSSGH